MYPAAFDYHAPKNVKEALGLLGKLKDDAKILAGGHSLIPMMKLRLAQPKHLIDLGKVPGLSGIKADGKALVIGAMTTRSEEHTSELQSPCNLVCRLLLEKKKTLPEGTPPARPSRGKEKMSKQ